MLIGLDGANIQQFPDIPAVSAEILALRGWEGEDKRRGKDADASPLPANREGYDSSSRLHTPRPNISGEKLKTNPIGI